MDTIKIIMKGGVIQNIFDIPKDVDVQVVDYDCAGPDRDNCHRNPDGDWYYETLWTAEETT